MTATPAPGLVRHPLKARLLQVQQVQELAPRLRRITLQGPDMGGFTSAAPDDHVKLLFPAPGQLRPVLPVFGPQGPTFPEGAERPVARDYTPRAFDSAQGTLVLDFVLHGHGPAGLWARHARAGDWLGVAGPRASRVVPDVHDAYLLAGDETALPAIGRWLEQLPAGRAVTVLCEVDGADDQIELPRRARCQIHWLHRQGPPAGDSGLLAAAVAALTLPPGSVYAWVAAESSQMRLVRQHLQRDRGFDAAHLYAAGYWKRGQADHDDEH
jgi:NADPH-dependent ferric siderophore reductase